MRLAAADLLVLSPEVCKSFLTHRNQQAGNGVILNMLEGTLKPSALQPMPMVSLTARAVPCHSNTCLHLPCIMEQVRRVQVMAELDLKRLSHMDNSSRKRMQVLMQHRSKWELLCLVNP